MSQPVAPQRLLLLIGVLSGVIIGAVVAGPGVGTLIGLIFGVSSLVLAAVAPKSPSDVFFTDPWVSVVPRLFVGVAAWAVYRLARRGGKRWTLVAGGLILAAVAIVYGDVGMTLRVLMTMAFLLLTAPVAAHLIGRAAYRSGITLSSHTWVDQLKDQRLPTPDEGADPSTRGIDVD